jgi:UDP-N-acetylmuramoyl-L-alanyl-D-glutamate--2,6-diaminopimelate ligase
MPQMAVPLGWHPQHLLAGLTSALPNGEYRIEHLALDAAECGPGTLFLAAYGSAEDRLRGAARAAASGCLAIAIDPDAHSADAAALAHLSKALGVPVVPVPRLDQKAGEIAARFFADPSTELDVIGVFGRRRAAIVSHLVAQALTDQRCGLIGELGYGFLNELHDDGRGVSADPLLLQDRLAHLLAAGARAVATACMPESLLHGSADSLQIRTAVFASGPRPGKDERTEIAALRRVATQSSLRWAVVNRDAPFSAQMESALDRRVARACFSLQPNLPLTDCDCWARAGRIAPTANGLAIELETSLGSGSLEVPLLGRFNVPNVLAVISALLTTGRDLRSALAVVARLHGVPGRMEPFTAAHSPLVVVDSANRPRALLHAIRQLRDHRMGRLITVFGCAGGEDPANRSRMGAVAERLSDRVILTDDSPRTEDGDRIIEAILAGTSAPERIVVERQRALAIRRAITLAGVDDTVLVAGKGHETTQDMGELKVHFSDRAQVVQALSERQGSNL